MKLQNSKEKAIRSHRLKRRKLLRPIRKTKTENEMYNDAYVYYFMIGTFSFVIQQPLFNLQPCWILTNWKSGRAWKCSREERGLWIEFMNFNEGFICINPSFQGFICINPSFQGFIFINPSFQGFIQINPSFKHYH